MCVQTLMILTFVLAIVGEFGLAQEKRQNGMEFCRNKYQFCMERTSHKKLHSTKEYCDRVIKRRYYCVNRNLGDGQKPDYNYDDNDKDSEDSFEGSDFANDGENRQNRLHYGNNDNDRNGTGEMKMADGIEFMSNMGDAMSNPLLPALAKMPKMPFGKR